ncbi:RCC1 domain-containing protein [Sandaracinus amylolyticus]|uniref:BNR repeat domain protein n=1 Tax=Sandaracinus amylolyticus TaxID=927083 RepID=A0A0F6W2L7_9BACT|nr:RCC1 domain-containing protein [Sandaracinus amylolyticus]AKF05906.1 BNR repeat domain protein [Sandaracinus amylolyticus]
MSKRVAISSLLVALHVASCTSPGCPEGYTRRRDRCFADDEACDGVDLDGDQLDDVDDPHADAWCNDPSRAMPFALARCGASGCEVDECDAQALDCSSEPGCETDPRVTAEHCGECGHACGWACRASTCDDAVELAGGFDFMCALRASGSVVCWGSNNFGNLGDGTVVPRATPVTVIGVGDVVEISAGQNHACARLSSGAVWCWGENAHEQLGGGATLSYSTVPVEVLASELEVVEIAAGGFHTCARRAGGRVVCWGDNVHGQIGDGRVGLDASTPYDVGIEDAVEIAAGGFHTCARRASGSVVCWGNNMSGQLGDGTAENLVPRVPSTDVKGLVATAIRAGAAHTCAIRVTGGVVCWGSGFWGQLGIGIATEQLEPVVDVELDGVDELVTGNDHTCALVDASLRCWGHNETGELGMTTLARVGVPPAVPAMEHVASIAASSRNTCAILETGAVVCWGGNEHGQVGDGTSGEPRRAPGAPVAAPE